MNVSATGNAERALVKTPGAPDPLTIAEANIRTMAARGFNDYVVVEGANQASNEFPYQPFVTDAYDYIAGLKQSQMRDDRSNVKIEFDKEDAEYMLRQRAQVENADFDRWVMQKYDLSDPGDRMMAQRVIPELFDRQKETLAYQTQLQNRYAKLRIDGPKSDDDLKFEWLVESGRIDLPQGPLWDPQKWMAAQYEKDNNGVAVVGAVAKSEANRNRFKRGLFNPIQPIDQTQTGWKANTNNESDIRGQENTYLFPHQLFGGSLQHGATWNRYGKNPIITSSPDYQSANIAGYKFGRGAQRAGASVVPGPPNAAPARIPAVPEQPFVPAVAQVVDPLKPKRVIVPYRAPIPFRAAQPAVPSIADIRPKLSGAYGRS